MTESTEQTTLVGRKWMSKSHDFDINALPLLPLHRTTDGSNPSYILSKNLRQVLRAIEFRDVLYIDFDIDPPITDNEVPMIMATTLSAEERHVARHSRKICRYPNQGTEIYIPPCLLNAEGTAEVGLGLDLTSYSNDNRLLFRVCSTQTCFSLLPFRYENGEDYTYTKGNELSF